MSEEILSQDEIDALLTGVDEGGIDTSAGGSSPDFSVYDLSSQDKLVRSRLPTLEVINEKFARHLRASLFAMLKRSVEVDNGTIQIQKYSEYIDSLNAPACMSLVSMLPLRGSALFTLQQPLVVKLVDSFFGGEGHEPRTEAREFTPAELRIADIFLNHAMQGVRESWSKVSTLEVNAVGFESNPATVAVSAPNDPIIVNSFRIEFDEFNGDFHVAIPYGMIDPVKDALLTTSKAAAELPEESWTTAIRRDILSANVNLGCTVAERDISLRDVVDLREGDVIPVEIPKTLTLQANGIPVFKVKLGRSRGNLALEVISKTGTGV